MLFYTQFLDTNLFFFIHSSMTLLRSVFTTMLDFFTSNLYTKLFTFSFSFANTNLLNITNLYSYILSIEILIVVCVLFVHSSIIKDDSSEISQYNSSEEGYFLIDSLYNALQFQIVISSNANTSIGIGHKLESFLDFFFLVIPTSIIIYILIPSLGLLYNTEYDSDYSNSIMTVDIIAHQWYWSYNTKYNLDNSIGLSDFMNVESTEMFDSIMTDEKPRFVSVDNSLYLPSNCKILFTITSEDVIHSFSIPDIGIKVDAIPGRVAVVEVLFLSEGSYIGQCSELCGANHAFMPISITVIHRSCHFSLSIDTEMLYSFFF